MYSTTPFQLQYRIINRDQEVWIYDSLEDAVLALGRAAREQGFFLSEVLANRFSSETRVDLDGVLHTVLRGHLIVRTSQGDVVFRNEVLALHARFTARRSAPEGDYRRGPWPGIRRPRGHRGSSIRIVRTKQAMTWDSADRQDLLDAGVPPVRTRRQRDLPTYWSDIPRRNERSWKSQRKTRWRS